jgi:hypothetical protein
VRGYVELPELSEIVLEESYVLGVTALPGQVTFDMDFVLTPAHPLYAPPPPSESECFRRGTLRLFGVRRLEWDEQGRPPATDASGERDFGHVDSFEWDHERYVLCGDWGRIDAVSEGAEITLAPH